MSAKLSMAVLILLNLMLAAYLAAALMAPAQKIYPELSAEVEPATEPPGPSDRLDPVPQDPPSETNVTEAASAPPTAEAVPARAAEEPTTTFSRMYSEDPQEFAANLRAIRCPEATVRDILVADISRKYRKQEEDLRPTPADHVPMGWSSATSEARLLQRRVRAAAVARQKAVEVEQALGYSVPISLPLYAMTATDRRLEEQWEQYPEPERILLNQVQENYWKQARVLQERTSGFWQSEDYSELKRLKAEWQTQIQHILEQQ